MPKPTRPEELRIAVAAGGGATPEPVSALWLRPRGARAVYVFAHGAGAGMTHPFMEAIARELAARGIATLRYQFPYMEHGKRAPSARPLLLETVRAAVAEGVRRARKLPVFAGGKSMGGRMTSLAAAEAGGLPGVGGIAFVGFPLHAPKKPGTERADHLRAFDLPLLFLQGTRDPLAPLEELEPVIAALGARARLHVVDGGDHSFGVLKRSGRAEAEVLSEIADELGKWCESVPGTRSKR